MPQASPMNWLLLSLMMSTSILSSFSHKNKISQTSKTHTKTNLASKNMSWKW